MSGIVGQNTLDNSGLIKAPAGGGAWNFISKQTASASADISFTSGIDSTYKEYIFTFNNIHAGTNRASLTFNVSIDSGSNYNVAKTTTDFVGFHYEDDSSGSLYYGAGEDLAEGTGGQLIIGYLTDDNDSSGSGMLHLFDPSSVVFVKHFMATCQNHGETGGGDDYSYNAYTAGYANTTSAVDAVQFKMNSGNIDAGDICLYGITT